MEDREDVRPAGGRSEALVTTDRAERYGKQLVAHLGRRNGGEWSELDRSGWIDCASGRAELSCAPDGLHLSVQGDPADLDRLEDVVGRHLVRFGARDELHVRWSRGDGKPGTEQHRDTD